MKEWLHNYSIPSLSYKLTTVNPEIFARILFSRIALKDIFVALKFAIFHDLRILVNYRVVSPFREDFVFTKLRICEVSRK